MNDSRHYPPLGWLLRTHLGLSPDDVAEAVGQALAGGLARRDALTVEGAPADAQTPVPWEALIRVGRQLYRLRQPAGLCRLTTPEPWDILPPELWEGASDD